MGTQPLILLTGHKPRCADVFVPLHGAHQVDNAAIALAAAQAHVGTPLDEETVHEGFARVTSPGRLEVMGTQPLILLDGAHNAAGAAALDACLRDEFAPQPRTLVVGLLREKDPAEMLAALEVAGRRAAGVHPPAHAARARPGRGGRRRDRARRRRGPHRRVRRRRRAVGRARDVTAADGQIVVTGSLYVVGAARAALH